MEYLGEEHVSRGAAGAKALRQELDWCSQTTRRPVSLEPVRVGMREDQRSEDCFPAEIGSHWRVLNRAWHDLT